MKTRKEIEEYLNGLGIELKSCVRKIPYNENGILTFEGYKASSCNNPKKKYFMLKIINKDVEEALLNLVKESIIKGDYETVDAAIDVLQQESERYKVSRDAALRGVPFEKKMKYWDYCQEQENGEENKEDLSTYVSVKQRKAMERDDEER
ncbi:MAG: hypothetical protein J5881_03410 [Clostridia bacterium]|nr:hypothetical protein [Clostridia bacterium]